MKKHCEVEGCDRVHHAKGLCSKHYLKLLRGGDPRVPSCKELTPEERFKNKLGPKDPVTGCTEWVGHRESNGYGRISREGKMVYTHRLAYELKHGPIPKGKCVCHTCDNPPCCNDEHLFLGTDADNAADREAKGRGNPPKGEMHYRAKLTEMELEALRRRLAAGESQRKIAAAFGVTQSQVSNINTGKRRYRLKTNKT